MTISPLALQAKRVIDNAWLHGAPYDLASQAAFALESAQLLQSPETAAESAVSAQAVPVGPEPQGYGSVFPWAALMDAEDLAEFLAELEHAIATSGATPAEALAAVEKACGTWRLIAEAQHGHNAAPGPDAMTRTFAPTQVLRDVPDGEHAAWVRHSYRTPHDLDLPETGGGS